MSKRFHAVLLGMLFVWVALAFYLRAADGTTLPRELVGCLAGGYFTVLALVENRTLFRSGSAVFLLLFLGWMGVDSLAVASLKMEALKGGVDLLLIAGAFFSAVYASSKGGSYEKLLVLTVGAGGLLAAYGVWQAFGPDLFNWTTRFERRAMSSLANPDYLAGYLVALFPPALVLMLRSKTQMSWLGIRLALVLILSALVLTRVFGGFIALAVAVLFLLGAFLSPWGRDLFKRNLRFVLTVLGLCLIGMVGYIFHKGGPALVLSKQVSIQQRMDKYKIALEMVRANPWTGIGLGQVGLQFPRFQSKPFPPLDPAHGFIYAEHIENDCLQFAVEGGFPALGLFLALLLAFAVSVFRFVGDPGHSKQDKELMIGVAGGMVALLAQSLSNFPLRVAPTSVLFGLLLAGPLALNKAKPSAFSFPEGKVQRFLPGLAALVAAVVGLRAVAASIAYRNAEGEASFGNAQLAAHYAARLVPLSPWNPKAWAAEGDALRAGNQLDPALEAYQRSIDLNPYAVETLAKMAKIKVKQGRIQEALDLAQKAEAIAPNYADPLVTGAVGLFEVKRFQESADEFRKCLVYYPNSRDAWLYLGMCDAHLGRKSDALECWKKAQFDPGDPRSTAFLRSQGITVR